VQQQILKGKVMLKAATWATLATLAGCATPINPPITGYTCCNLHPEYDWVSSNNVQGGALLPAGQPVVLDSVKKKYYVYGSMGGTAVGLRDDNSKSEAETLEWVRHIVVAESPKAKLATWPADVREAVQSGKVLVGMTREQVLVSLGYPAKNDTPKLDAPVWRYWTAQADDPVELHFDEAGRLTKLTGSAAAVAAVSAAP
jgi:hypothetical protein